MSELIEITRALEQVRNFPPLHRILLTCSGTLQGTLSAYFGREIGVQVVEQTEEKDNIIRRTVHLHDDNLVVCEAASQLNIEREDVRDKVLEGSLGIGQVLETLGVRPSFELQEVGQDLSHFWRRYFLRGPGVVYAIKETFPRVLYYADERAGGNQ